MSREVVETIVVVTAVARTKVSGVAVSGVIVLVAVVSRVVEGSCWTGALDLYDAGTV